MGLCRWQARRPANQGFKGRGVSYWAASSPVAGQPCQKMVYIGTMDGELHGVDADTGKACPGFGNNGVVNVDAWNTINHKWKVGLIQPPAVYKDTLILGWAGLDWVYKIENPGTVYRHRCADRQAEMDLRSHSADQQNQTGTANVWAGISVDPKRAWPSCRCLRPAPTIMAATG